MFNFFKKKVNIDAIGPLIGHKAILMSRKLYKIILNNKIDINYLFIYLETVFFLSKVVDKISSNVVNDKIRNEIIKRSLIYNKHFLYTSLVEFYDVDLPEEKFSDMFQIHLNDAFYSYTDTMPVIKDAEYSMVTHFIIRILNNVDDLSIVDDSSIVDDISNVALIHTNLFIEDKELNFILRNNKK